MNDTLKAHQLIQFWFLLLLILCRRCYTSARLDDGRYRTPDLLPSSYSLRVNLPQDEIGRSRIQVYQDENGVEFKGERQDAQRILDLSQIHSSKMLRIDSQNRADVIMASSTNCSVENLEVAVPHLITESVGENCKNLSVITMRGGGWNCSWPGWPWLKRWHEEDDHENNQPNAECLDLPGQCNNTMGEFSTGLFYQMVCKDGISRCHPCDCKFQYREDVSEFLATVDCSDKNLTNDRVPKKLPRNADFFSFEGNRLSDVTELLDQTKDMPHLKVINLSNNLLREVPTLQSNHAGNLSVISLANNFITQLRGPALSLFLNRSGEVGLHIKGNPLECDCQFYEIATDLKAQGARSVLLFFPDFLDITCPGGSLPKLYPHNSCPSSPLRPPLFPHLYTDLGIAALAAANIACMVLAVDLQIAIYQLKRGYSQPRIPWIHVLYMLFSRLPKGICHKRPSKPPPQEIGQVVAVEEDLDTRLRRHSS